MSLQPVVNPENAARLSRVSLDSADFALMAAPTGDQSRYALPSKLAMIEIRKDGWLFKVSDSSETSM